MSKISFEGFWAKQWQTQFKIPRGYLLIKIKGIDKKNLKVKDIDKKNLGIFLNKLYGFQSKKKELDFTFEFHCGYLLIKVKDIYKKNLGIFLNKLHDFQSKKKELRELDFTFEFHYKKRGINQNNLMWALYEIEANEMNGGLQGSKDHMVTSMELYESDLKIYAPKIEIKIPVEQYNYYRSNYRVEKEFSINDGEGNTIYYQMTLFESTSHFNTFQIAKWIDRQFNRLAQNGVSCTNPGDIHDYWVKWRNSLNTEKIIIHDSLLTIGEYRKLNPICEATGKYIREGKGQICHIKARGMGGNHEIEKDYASNLLHLCNEAHIEIQHQKGWSHFLKKFPHLKYKIEIALRREYPEEIEGKCLYNEVEKNKEALKKVFEGEELNDI